DRARQAVPGMLGEEALLAHPRGRPQQAERTIDEVWKYPVGDLGVEFGEALLGDAGVRPQDALGMGEAHAGEVRLGRRSGLGRAGFERDVFCRHVLAQALVGGLADEALLGPATELALADELGLRPAHGLLGTDRQRLAEGRPGGMDGLELVAQSLRLGARIAGADAPRVMQLTA